MYIHWNDVFYLFYEDEISIFDGDVSFCRLTTNNMLWMCTYILNWMNYSVFAVGMRNLYFFENYELHILGAVSLTGKFCLSLIVVSSHEDWVSQVSILDYLKSLGVKPGWFMVKKINDNCFWKDNISIIGDGATAWVFHGQMNNQSVEG